MARTFAQLTAAAVVLLAIQAARADQLFDLQALPTSDEFFSEGLAISGDGRLLGGRGTSAVRAWLLNDSFQHYFLPVWAPSRVSDISADGSVVVGRHNADVAFLWSISSGLVELGDLDPATNGTSYATGVSADGTRITGSAISPGGTRSFLEAFLYTVTNPATGAGSMVGLGDLPGGDTYSEGAAISQDGSTVVGGSSSAASIVGGGPLLDFEAFRWTAASGMIPLGSLPGGAFYSYALAVSADGNVVVGGSSSAQSGISGVEAFRWTPQGGMVGLGDLPGGNFMSVALAVSADGSIVVGASAVAIGDGGLDEYAPFIWDPVNGMRDLRAVFAARGLSMPNLRMTHATAISDDGTTITGYGKSVFRTPALDLRTEAWVGILDRVIEPPPAATQQVPALPSLAMLGFALLLPWLAYRLTTRRDR